MSRNGNQAVNVPQESANVWASRAFGSRRYAQAGVRYVGSFFTTTANTQRAPSYTLVDLMATWAPTPMVEFDLRITNVADAFYAYTSTSGGDQWILGPPRAAELGIRITF